MRTKNKAAFVRRNQNKGLVNLITKKQQMPLDYSALISFHLNRVGMLATSIIEAQGLGPQKNAPLYCFHAAVLHFESLLFPVLSQAYYQKLGKAMNGISNRRVAWDEPGRLVYFTALQDWLKLLVLEAANNNLLEIQKSEESAEVADVE